MEVRDHRLYERDGAAVRFIPSSNHSEGLEPLYLLIHYTATSTLPSVVRWFMNPASNASAHIVVGRDGEAVQMVPLNRRAWHAGRSRWGALDDLNAYSIGIELVNAGALELDESGGWVDWAGNRIADCDVIVARQKHERAERGWHAFTDAQIERTLEIAACLHRRYGFKDVLGHEDVAPNRKIDPGPAFPMDRFALQLAGVAHTYAAAEDAR